MRTLVRFTVALGICILASTLPRVEGHGGGLDKCGGHHDRKNGGYHVHNWGAYCGCHPETAECSSRNSAPTKSSTAAAVGGPQDELAALRARVERLEARVGALEKAIAAQ